MRKFTYKDIRKLEDDIFWFECAMVSTCKPVFDNCDDNHDVEDVLRKAKVISKNDEPDSECCALVVNFESRKRGEEFIDRLNKFLER